MARAWMDWAAAGKGEKGALLQAWSRIEGVYIPSFFEPNWDAMGFQQLTPKAAG